MTDRQTDGRTDGRTDGEGKGERGKRGEEGGEGKLLRDGLDENMGIEGSTGGPRPKRT